MLKKIINHLIFFLPLFIIINSYSLTQDDYYKLYDKIDNTKNWQEGIKTYKNAIIEFPDEPWFYIYLNYSLRNAKLLDEALSQIIEARKKFPDNKDIKDNYKWCLIDYGWAKVEKKEFKEAYRVFLESYKLDPENEWIINAYGYILCSLKQFNESINILKNGYKKYPNNEYIKGNYINSILTYGWDYADKKDFENAYKLFKECYEFSPDNEWTINAYGYILKETGDLDESAKILTLGRIKFPGNESIINNLLYTYIALNEKVRDKDLLKAEEYLKKVESIDANNESFLLNYGYHLMLKKDYPNAITTYEKGLKIYPNDEWFLPNIKWAYYEWADQEKKDNNFIKAINIYNDGITKFPNEVWYYSNLWDCYYKTNKFEESAQAMLNIARICKEKNLKMLDNCNLENLVFLNISMSLYKIAADNKYKKLFQIIDDLDKYIDSKFIIYQLKGNFLFYSGQKSEGIDMVYKAYNFYITDHPENKKSVIIPLPLKGLIMTAGCSRLDAITHAGMNQYCYDFWGVTNDGRSTKADITGYGNNEDFVGFGIPIYSPVNGEVIDVVDDKMDISPTPEYKLQDGNSITIKDANGYNYIFVHNKNKSAKVKKGQTVKTGDIIANLGNTGMTTSPHLHFGVYSSDWIVSVPVIFTDYKLTKKDGSKINIKSGTPKEGEIIEN